MVNDPDVLTVEKAKYPLSQLSRALSGDDLDARCLLGNGLVHDRAKRAVDFVTAVIDIVQVKLELHQAIVVPQGDERESLLSARDLPTDRTGGAISSVGVRGDVLEQPGLDTRAHPVGPRLIQLVDVQGGHRR